MSAEETWAFLKSGHTGILTTLRRTGEPIALPVWYVTRGRRIYVAARGKKLLRLESDARCSFLVEEGEYWSDLRAAHLACKARILDVADELVPLVMSEIAAKYASHRSSVSDPGSRTVQRYDRDRPRVVELTPVARELTWDNRRLITDT